MRPLLTKDGRAFCAAEIEDLSGSLEVTVWPDVFEATRDLWTAGTIVLLAVRLRPRDDRLGVAVLRATPYSGESDPALLADFSAGVGSAPAPAPARSGGNPRFERNSGPRAQAAAAVTTHLPLLVLIEINETEDEAGDRRRLADLIRLLSSAPGDDRSRLLLRTRGEDVSLQAPSINLTEGLEGRIRAVLGPSGLLTTTALPASTVAVEQDLPLAAGVR